MNMIDNEGNQKTQQYTKEIQPQNNNSNSGNNSTVNIYTDGTKTTASTSSSGSSGSDSISKIQKVATNQGVDYAVGAIGGSIVLGGGAVIGDLLNSRKALSQGIKNFF